MEAAFTAAETLIRNLAHDLRQPLSNIETCACYLKIVIAREYRPAEEHLEMIEQQVEQAERMLCEVLAALRQIKAQSEAGAAEESLDLTKSTTPALT